MTLQRTLYESPSGLVHVAELIPVSVFRQSQNLPRAITVCGREINEETWSRISMLDEWMFSQGPKAIRRKLELPACEKCLPRY